MNVYDPDEAGDIDDVNGDDESEDVNGDDEAENVNGDDESEDVNGDEGVESVNGDDEGGEKAREGRGNPKGLTEEVVVVVEDDR